MQSDKNIVKVGPRGQITIPKHFQQAMGIVPGRSSIVIEQMGDNLVLSVVNETIFDLVGCVESPRSEPLGLEEMDAVAKRHVAARHRPD